MTVGRAFALGAVLVTLAAAGDAEAKKRAKAAPPIFALRLRIDADGGAAAAAAAAGPARPGEAIVPEGDDLVLSPFAQQADAWARAAELLELQPWSRAEIVIDGARVIDLANPAAVLPFPAARDLAKALAPRGARFARLLVVRASAFPMPDFELPAAAEEIVTLAAGKKLGAVVLGEREVCDARKTECMGWYRVLAPARGDAGLSIAWVPMASLLPEPAPPLWIRRLGRSIDAIAYDVINRAGARTYCTVPASAPVPARAVKGKGKNGAKLYGPAGELLGNCNALALNPAPQ